MLRQKHFDARAGGLRRFDEDELYLWDKIIERGPTLSF